MYHKALKWVGEGGEKRRGRERDVVRKQGQSGVLWDRVLTLLGLKMEEGGSSGSWKRRGNKFSTRASREEHSSANTLILVQWNLAQTADLQNGQRMNLCYCKPLYYGDLLTAAAGNSNGQFHTVVKLEITNLHGWALVSAHGFFRLSW